MTPEQQWDNIKNKLFINGVPKSIDDVVKNGFKDSEDESEKWEKLHMVLKEIKSKLK